MTLSDLETRTRRPIFFRGYLTYFRTIRPTAAVRFSTVTDVEGVLLWVSHAPIPMGQAPGTSKCFGPNIRNQILQGDQTT